MIRTPSRKAIAAFVATVAIVILGLLAYRWNRGETHEEPPNATSAADSVLQMDSTALRLAGVEIVTVQAAGGGELAANGTITYDANRVSVVSSRVDARVVAVRADLGQSVAAGSTLAVLESAEVGQIRGDLERARANVDIARRNYDREKRLFEEQISPQKEMLDAEAAYRTAEADLRSASAKLSAIGADRAGTGQGATFGLVAAVSGTVVERNCSPGQSVGPTSNLFTVADLRNVWITVDIYEGDLAHIKQGATAHVTPTAFPNEQFTGRVTYAGGVVDTSSRTFKVRVEVANTALRLRPGMFAQVKVQATGVDSSNGLPVVPEIAVQELDGRHVVFVAQSSTGRFMVRPVVVGSRAGAGSIVITSGLSAGERIVARGAFQLKAELTKASFGESE